jgi:hypothetical protein
MTISACADADGWSKGSEYESGQRFEISIRWGPDRRRAKHVVDTCRDELARDVELSAGGWLGIEPALAARAIEIVADRLGVWLASDVHIQEHAEAGVCTVEIEVERMKRSGELRDVNRAYREQRIAREATGRKIQPYGVWFANWRLAMIKVAAEQAAARGTVVRSVTDRVGREGASDQIAEGA